MKKGLLRVGFQIRGAAFSQHCPILPYMCRWQKVSLQDWLQNNRAPASKLWIHAGDVLKSTKSFLCQFIIPNQPKLGHVHYGT